MTANPTISVLMPVFNAGAFLRPAVESILAQTGVSFEFIIVDDGSTDGSTAYLNSIGDARVLLLEGSHAGLVAALNRGLNACRAPFIARMDADDVALPGRLLLQLEHFAANPRTDILCSDVRLIDSTGRDIGCQRVHSLDNARLRAGLLGQRRLAPIIHPSVMVRRDALIALQGYRDYPAAEDHDLWLRAVDRYTFRRLEHPLLQYRVHAASVSRQQSDRQAVSAGAAVVNYLVARETGIDLFRDRADTFTALRKRLQAMQAQKSRAQHALGNARQLLRSGMKLRAMASAVATLALNGPAALPALAARRRAATLGELAQSICAQLDAGGAG